MGDQLDTMNLTFLNNKPRNSHFLVETQIHMETLKNQKPWTSKYMKLGL